MLVSVMLFAGAAAACDSEPAPWYSVAAEFDSETLPEGIVVVDDGDPSTFVVRNPTSTPLRVEGYGPRVQDQPEGRGINLLPDLNRFLDGQKWNSGRPDAPPVPDPEPFVLPLEFGEEVIEVTGVATYAVNQNYEAIWYGGNCGVESEALAVGETSPGEGANDRRASLLLVPISLAIGAGLAGTRRWRLRART